MSHICLAIIWLVYGRDLGTVYFILMDMHLVTDGFPFVTKRPTRTNQVHKKQLARRGAVIVWLLQLVAATFAAFPVHYSNMFSYL